MRNLSEARIERGLPHGGRFAGAKFKPRAEPGLLIIRRGVGELDAEVAATRETDEQHGIRYARVIDRPHEAAAHDPRKALGQFFAPARSGEDVGVVAERDRHPTNLSF